MTPNNYDFHNFLTNFSLSNYEINQSHGIPPLIPLPGVTNIWTSDSSSQSFQETFPSLWRVPPPSIPESPCSNSSWSPPMTPPVSFYPNIPPPSLRNPLFFQKTQLQLKPKKSLPNQDPELVEKIRNHRNKEHVKEFNAIYSQVPCNPKAAFSYAKEYQHGTIPMFNGFN